MKKGLFIAVFLLCAGLMVTGCAQQPKAANAEQAIEQSKSLPTVEEKAEYLVKQANAFVNSKDFEQAIQTAKHVLVNLDANSAEAKSILEKATEEMKKSLGAMGNQ